MTVGDAWRDRGPAAREVLGSGLGERRQGVALADGGAAVRRSGPVELAFEEGQRLCLERHGRFPALRYSPYKSAIGAAG
jgi:hypothetical protein